LVKHCDEIEPWELWPMRTVIERLIDDGAHTNLIHELLEKYLEHGGLDHQELVKRLLGRSPNT